MAYFYAVTATLPDDATASEYLAWLRHGHTQQVVAAGASSARIVRLDGGAGDRTRIETQYVFPDRAAFDRYVATAAPALRAEGLARFPASRGIAMERRSGEIDEG
jgi:hypothetical protein